MNTLLRPALLAALAAGTLSACVVAPAPRGYYPAPQPVYAPPAPVYSQAPLAIVDQPPPPPLVEVVPVIPFPGAIWIRGYWGWQGGRHLWVGGRWEAPRAGYAWHPHEWVAVGGRWHLREGGWRPH